MNKNTNINNINDNINDLDEPDNGELLVGAQIALNTPPEKPKKPKKPRTRKLRKWTTRECSEGYDDCSFDIAEEYIDPDTGRILVSYTHCF